MNQLDNALEALNPTDLTRDEWVAVGMGMHHEGKSEDEWLAWSARDTRDAKHGYNERDARKVWRSFRTTNNGVTGGTVVKMAKDRGWNPVDTQRVYSWDDDIAYVMEPTPTPAAKPAQKQEESAERVIDPTWVESAEYKEPGADWKPLDDMARYISALFEPEDTIGYVVNSFKRDDGKFVPSGLGYFKESVTRVLKDLNRYEEDELNVILGATPDPEAGAWIRLNPLDGEGVRTENVSEFRYALVECDDMPQAKQLGLIRALNLPCAAIVDSGSKSVHAIVRIGAKNLEEYRERVDFLFRTCKENGLTVDTQNKNPSRLTRLPGVMRGSRKQWLISTDEGARSWAEWREWLAEQNDDLPEPECLADVWDDLPDLAPELIGGVLRQGHKMLLAGSSKAGKSFALIELCIAIAEGRSWMGFDCAQGRIMYVNLELDRASCLHRFRDVYEGLDIVPAHLKNIDIWNLRGKGKPMNELTPALIRRAIRTRPIAIVIDPIYKVITGDENSADEMAKFCNQFDKIADALGSSVIYCHHHSKGSQGQKRSMDRASGSGVFARDPDALLDVIELHIGDEERDKLETDEVKRIANTWLIDHDANSVETTAHEGEELFLTRAREEARTINGEKELLDAVYAARERVRRLSAWRIEGTLREFPAFDPVEVWFDYPAHRLDASGALKDMQPEGGMLDRSEYRAKGRERKAANDTKRQGGKLQALREGMQQCEIDGVDATLANVVERMPKVNGKAPTVGQVRNWIKPGKNDWCPITVEGGKGRQAGVLVDAQMANALDGW